MVVARLQQLSAPPRHAPADRPSFASRKRSCMHLEADDSNCMRSRPIASWQVSNIRTQALQCMCACTYGAGMPESDLSS